LKYRSNFLPNISYVLQNWVRATTDIEKFIMCALFLQLTSNRQTDTSRYVIDNLLNWSMYEKVLGIY